MTKRTFFEFARLKRV